jgi:hypothetical protein
VRRILFSTYVAGPAVEAAFNEAAAAKAGAAKEGAAKAGATATAGGAPRTVW